MVAVLLTSAATCASVREDKINARADSATTYDPKTKTYTISCAPIVSFYPNACVVTGVLRVEKTEAEIGMPKLLITYTRRLELPHFVEATSGRDEPLVLTPFDQQVGVGNGVAERVIIDIPIELLKRDLESGLRVRVIGKKGNFAMLLPKRTLEAFFRAIERAEPSATDNPDDAQ